MDDQEKPDFNDHESTSEDRKETDEKQKAESEVVKSYQKWVDHENVGPTMETKLNIEPLETGFNKDLKLYEPGPSRIHLPGAINSNPKVNIHTRLSKSEHSIPQIITAKDVANALKLTSISFRNNNITPLVTNLHLHDLKIPVEAKLRDKTERVGKVDSNTMVDLKNFMAASFKLMKEPSIVQAIPEVPVHKSYTTNLVMSEQHRSECSRITVTAQTDMELMKPSEVVTKQPGIDPKASKTTENSKKTNSSISERSDLLLAQRDSLSSIGSNVCRICMTRGRERLISPCNCKGSLANVHLSCLERWLNQVGRNHCELCGFCYPAIRTPRYTVLQALRLWFENPRNRSHLQSDCLIFWLLSTVTAGLLAVCIVGTQYFVIEGSKFGKLEGTRKYEGMSHRVTETAMDFFMAIVLCGYSVTVYLLWKDHYVMWNRWRRANVNVRLLLSHDAEPVPFVPRQQPRYHV